MLVSLESCQCLHCPKHLLSPRDAFTNRKMYCKRTVLKWRAYRNEEPLIGRASRRQVIAAEMLLLASPLLQTPPALALGFQKELKKKRVPLEQYSTLEDGIKYFDASTGSGEIATPGQTVTVHFDVNYKSLDVVSTRSARLLGGNRSVAEPFEFTVGQPVSAVGVKKINDSANGLFSGQGGVKPPPALSTAVIGMKTGGKRLVNVTPDIGYGDKGLGEIPPNATVSMSVELLAIKK